MNIQETHSIINSIIDALKFEVLKIAKINGCTDLKDFGKLWKDEQETLSDNSWEGFLETLNGGDDFESLLEESIQDAQDSGIIVGDYSIEQCLLICYDNSDIMQEFCDNLYKEMFE